MAELLAAEGMAAATDAESADLVVLNTCHIREKAAEKVYSEIGRLKKNNAGSRVVVAGCVAQAEGEEIVRRAPSVDVVVGPQAYHRLPELIRQAGERRAIDTDMPPVSKFEIGRASCRERVVAVRVDLGGRRIIKKKRTYTACI